MCGLDEYRHMWDGSEPGWRLQQCDHVEWRVTFQFTDTGPTLQQVASLRSLLDEFRDLPTIAVWHRLRGCTSYSREQELGNIESHRLVESAKQVGLNASATSVDRRGYLPIDPDGNYLIIEDDGLSAQVAQQMIAAGIPIEVVHVD